MEEDLSNLSETARFPEKIQFLLFFFLRMDQSGAEDYRITFIDFMPIFLYIFEEQIVLTLNIPKQTRPGHT